MTKLLIFLLCVTVNSESGRRNLLRNVQYKGDVLDSFYNVYDVSYLARAWPTVKNGLHLVTSDDCFEDVKVFLKDFSKGRAWAFIAADASGHYNSGAYSGSRHWLGSKQQCLRLDKKENSKIDKEILEKHSDVFLNAVLRKEFSHGQEWKTMADQEVLMQRALPSVSSPPLRLAFTAVRLTLNITKLSLAKCHEIVQGVCLPRSCSPEDVSAILNFSIMLTDTLKSNKTIPRTVKLASARRIEDTYDITRDIQALCLLSTTGLLFLLSLIATLVDYNIIKCKRRAKSKTFNVQKYNNDLKKTNLVDVEAMPINVGNNINMVSLKKVMDTPVPPCVTLDVMSLENRTNSCKRCGKYKKQCVMPKMNENLEACPRIKYSHPSLVERHFCQHLLLCFSLNYSWKRIFNTNMANKDLSVMHGFRIVTTFWVVFIHAATVTSYLSDNNDVGHHNVYMILATGSIAFDTLFFISGLFSAYHFFYLKSQYSVEELVSFGGSCGQLLQLVCFITNRAVRLLPSYVYTIFLAAVLSRVSSRTATLELPGRDYDCGVNWWRNILYITNLYPSEERCLQISWYFTSETQLHAAGAVVCALAARRRLALALASLAVIVACSADVTSALSEYRRPLPDMFAAYRLIMERPWARVAPYFLGIFGGWLVRRVGGKLMVSRLTSSCLWLASLSVMVLASAVPWVSPAWVCSLLHAAWPAVLLWPALVCATDYARFCRRLLDSSLVAALSRLSYSILLLHGIITRTVLLSLDGALCGSTICIWSYYAGTTLLTLLASLLLSLLVEMPSCSLLRRLSDCANS